MSGAFSVRHPSLLCSNASAAAQQVPSPFSILHETSAREPIWGEEVAERKGAFVKNEEDSNTEAPNIGEDRDNAERKISLKDPRLSLVFGVIPPQGSFRKPLHQSRGRQSGGSASGGSVEKGKSNCARCRTREDSRKDFLRHELLLWESMDTTEPRLSIDYTILASPLRKAEAVERSKPVPRSFTFDQLSKETSRHSVCSAAYTSEAAILEQVARQVARTLQLTLAEAVDVEGYVECQRCLWGVTRKDKRVELGLGGKAPPLVFACLAGRIDNAVQLIRLGATWVPLLKEILLGRDAKELFDFLLKVYTSSRKGKMEGKERTRQCFSKNNDAPLRKMG